MSLYSLFPMFYQSSQFDYTSWPDSSSEYVFSATTGDLQPGKVWSMFLDINGVTSSQYNHPNSITSTNNNSRYCIGYDLRINKPSSNPIAPSSPYVLTMMSRSGYTILVLWDPSTGTFSTGKGSQTSTSTPYVSTITTPFTDTLSNQVSDISEKRIDIDIFMEELNGRQQGVDIYIDKVLVYSSVCQSTIYDGLTPGISQGVFNTSKTNYTITYRNFLVSDSPTLNDKVIGIDETISFNGSIGIKSQSTMIGKIPDGYTVSGVKLHGTLVEISPGNIMSFPIYLTVSAPAGSSWKAINFRSPYFSENVSTVSPAGASQIVDLQYLYIPADPSSVLAPWLYTLNANSPITKIGTLAQQNLKRTYALSYDGTTMYSSRRRYSYIN